MKAISEHRTQTRGNLGQRARATALVAFALALAPQWAAAQEVEETIEETTDIEETTQPAPEPVPLDTPEAVPPETWETPPAAAQPAPYTEDEVPPDSWEAEDTEDTEATKSKDEEKGGMGASVSAAGGVSEFARSEARDFINTGGTWDLRGVFGTRSLVGLEAAYIGTANGVDAPGESSSTLFGNGLEVSGRLNILRNGLTNAARGLQPYALGGVAWKNYQVDGDFETAAIDDSDDTFEVPVGGGLGYYFNNGVLLDARYAYRFAFGDDLIQPVGEDEANLDNWSVTGRIGAEF